MRIMKKRFIGILAFVCVVIVACLVSLKNTESETQLDYQFLSTFPFRGTIEEAVEWLEEKGYRYSIAADEEGITGKTLQGWDLDASTIYDIEGVLVYLHKRGSVTKCAEIYESCYVELVEMYGEPSRTNDTCAWYTNGEIVIGLINFNESVQIQIGSYNGMDKYL